MLVDTRGAAARVLAAAAAIVARVAAGESADAALARGPAASQPLAASVRAVAFGTLRWYPRVARLAELLREGRAVQSAVQALLAVALFQLEYSRNPIQATVSSAVEAARLAGQPRAAGLVNALLRRFLRERTQWLAKLASEPAAALAHPLWLLKALQTDWPAEWPSIVAANNTQAPMGLRVDLSRCSREELQAQLGRRGVAAHAVDGIDTALLLEQPVAVKDLPGFAEGLVSVQDPGAQLASRLLQAQPRERVLDACAAPGGKTGAILEAVSGPLSLTAVDVDAGRLQRVAENLRRLRREAQLICADLAVPGDWWDGRAFDRILLDAPCSAVGVIRRHPDIKLLRRVEDIGAFAERQSALLDRCLAMLAPRGRLVYATCSVLRAENDAVVAGALSRHTGLAQLS
ncbi:MAG TPA: 16S rRNA (cytosine(967)-C(5))-methyltransferase RsmB, partial [Steroidobacteraceae bacterium]|nr:16S rRNA (cytosine(967)-C(5))-methyltransferase RsmB [Steroidobacteraceae bacterium]